MKRERDNGFSEWGGYMEAKMSKLEDQFSVEAKNLGLKEDNLFKGLSIFVNGYTMPPAYELRNLMMKHGGTFHHYHRPDKTTYIVASNLPDSKLKQVNKLTVIKPEWITDCVKQGHLLNHKDYLLYTNQTKTQPLLQFTKCKIPEGCSPAKTAKDEKFLTEFYNNSRLHLISTMGATFKRYVHELRRKTKEFPGYEYLIERIMNEPEEPDKISGWGTVIMHIDMDCFFVSVSIRHRPDLVGHPVAVTHSKGNKPVARPGVDLQAEYKAYHGSSSSDPKHWSNTGQSYSMAEIASCNYEARQAGVKNGMFMGQALNLCPSLVALPYDFEGYKEVARTLYNTVARYTLNIEAVSCDEMFVDCTDLLTSVSMTPLEFSSIIRNEIKQKTDCPCSAGFGANKLQARLATRKAKPDGQFFLEPDMVLDFMSSVPVSDLPGVGRSTTYKLKSLGVTICSELQKLSLSSLKSEFGAKAGETLYNYSYGKDNKNLTFEKIRKSVSADVNYGIRFETDIDRDKFLKQLSEEVSNRLVEISMKGKSIALKIMVKSKDAPQEAAKFLGHGVCDYFTKTNSLKSHTDDHAVIFKEVANIMGQFNVPSIHLRGIGIQISKLISNQCAKNSLSKFFIVKTTEKQNCCPVNDNVETNKPYDLGATSELLISNRSQRLNQCSDKANCSKVSLDPENLSGLRKVLPVIEAVPIASVSAKNLDILTECKPGGSKNVRIGTEKGHRARYITSKIKNKTTYGQSELYNVSLSQIDPSFLEALPEELRAEILNNVKMKTPVVQFTLEDAQNALSGCKALDPFSGVNNGDSSLNDDSSNSLSRISPVEMRGLIKEWIQSCDTPEPCDVAMFSSYLVSLVTSRNIDQLHILLKTFSRQLKTSDKSADWTACYDSTVNEVQITMFNVYGAKLVAIN